MPQYDPLNPDKYTIHINILQSAIAPWAEIYRSAFLGLTEGTEVPAEVEAFLWKLGIMFRKITISSMDLLLPRSVELLMRIESLV